MYKKLFPGLALFFAALLPLAAQVPQVISQQGRIAVDGVNFTGNGQFRFAFVNATGTLSYWSNDGTSTAGSEPTNAVTIPVSNGHYSVLLGDPSLTNMSSLPDSLFDQSDLHLRIWFDDTGGSERLTPDRRIASVPFARRAGSVPAGSITGANLAAGSVGANQLANGAVQSSKIASGAVGASQLAAGAVNITKIATGAVGPSQLANNAVTSSKISNGTIQASDVNPSAFNQTFWRTGGNAGTTAGTHFLGTTDNQPLDFRSTNFRILRLESANIIGGSQFNRVTPGSIGATVFGGRNGAGTSDDNIASADLSTISGGAENRVTAVGGTVAGGINNSVGGLYGFVAGGQFNKADAAISFAAGQRAEARHPGCFVWSNSGNPYPSLTAGSVSFYAFGGFGIDWAGQAANGRGNRWIFIGPGAGNSIESWTGARLTDGGAWANSSDVHRKTAFAEIEPTTILDKVAALPIRQWRYKVESAEVTHLGPTAQDFRAAFALGDDDKSIATVDADGVALAAIQGLHRRLEETRSENVRLKQENTEFRRRLTLIEEKLAGLTRTTGK